MLSVDALVVDLTNNKCCIMIEPCELELSLMILFDTLSSPISRKSLEKVGWNLTCPTIAAWTKEIGMCSRTM